MTVKIDDVGEIMALGFHRDGLCWRPVVVVGPGNKPPEEAEVIWTGPVCADIRSATQAGRRPFFRLYRERYGFSHPEDPKADPKEVRPASVLVLNSLDDDGFREGTIARTYDPDFPPFDQVKH